MLDEVFALPVRVDWSLRVLLIHRHVLFRSVRGARGGEDEMVDAMSPHRIEHTQCRGRIVVIVLGWVSHRFADVGIGGKVYDGIDVEFGKYPVHESGIAHVAFNQWDALWHRFAMSV